MVLRDAFIVYDNYKVILKWNRSSYFGTAVGLLSDHIRTGKSAAPVAKPAKKPPSQKLNPQSQRLSPRLSHTTEGGYNN